MTASASPRLIAQGIRVTRGARTIIGGADLSLNTGEVTMLIGPNGAGKTTLLRALAGLCPHEGSVTLDGTPLPRLTPRQRAQRLAYLPQGHSFHWPLDVTTLVELGREPHADPFTPLSHADREAVARAMAATGVSAFADRAVTTLSGGEQARVALARALATEAGVLLADEPVAALDVRHQLVVMDIFRDIARNGAAVLMVMHDLALAARYADRIAVMTAGAIVACDQPARALDPQLVAEVFGVAVMQVDGPQGPMLVPTRALP